MSNGRAAQHRALTQIEGGRSIWTRIDAGTLADIVQPNYFTFRDLYKDVTDIHDRIEVLNCDLKYRATLRIVGRGLTGWVTELCTVSVDATEILARLDALELCVDDLKTDMTAAQTNIVALQNLFNGAAEGDTFLFTGGAWVHTNLKDYINACINARFTTSGASGVDLTLFVDIDGDGVPDICIDDCLNAGSGTGGNNAPVAGAGGPAGQTITNGSAINPMGFAGCFTDADGDALTYAIVPAVPGLVVGNTGFVTGSPIGLTTFPASVVVTVRASDPSGDFADCSATITVNAATGSNGAPTTSGGTAPANQTIVDGSAIATMSFAACFSDPDGDALTYSLAPPIAGLVVNAAGDVTGTPTGFSAPWPNALTVTVRATDPGGLFAECSAIVTVTDAAAPAITASISYAPSPGNLGGPDPATGTFAGLLDVGGGAVPSGGNKGLYLVVSGISGGVGPYTVDFEGVQWQIQDDYSGPGTYVDEIEVFWGKNLGVVSNTGTGNLSLTGNPGGVFGTAPAAASVPAVSGSDYAAFVPRGTILQSGNAALLPVNLFHSYSAGSVVITDSASNSVTVPVPAYSDDWNIT